MSSNISPCAFCRIDPAAGSGDKFPCVGPGFAFLHSDDDKTAYMILCHEASRMGFSFRVNFCSNCGRSFGGV